MVELTEPNFGASCSPARDLACRRLASGVVMYSSQSRHGVERAVACMRGRSLQECDSLQEREVGGVKAGQALPEAEAPIEQRIRQLLESAPVLLFMKGAPDAPRCGFSRQVVQALRADGIAFKHFDILTVRTAPRITPARAKHLIEKKTKMQCTHT